MIPKIKEKINSKATLNAGDIFLKNNSVRSLEDLPKAPQNCVLCPWSRAKEILDEKTTLTESVKIKNPVYTSENFALFTGYVGFGAPMWTWVLEQLIYWGVKNFIFIGWFGKVNPKINTNGIYVATRALRDEGTSYHYSEPSKWAYPDKELTDKLLTNKEVKPVYIWTTDAMFRQTETEIDYAIKNNIAGFEMELSALFEVAKFRKVKIASIQIVSDYFIDGHYKSIYRTGEEGIFEKNFKEAVRIAFNFFK